MIEFVDSHVDLMGDVTFTRQQLIRRWDQELSKKWRKEVQDNLRDFLQIKDSLDPETFPNYAENLALLSSFIQDKQQCYERRIADEIKNELLLSVLSYESAISRLEELTLKVEGRAEQQEVLDEFGTVVTPGVSAVDPIPATVEVDGEVVSNPLREAAMAEIAELQAQIDGASADVVTLSEIRAA